MLNTETIRKLITTLRTVMPNNPQLEKAEKVLEALPDVYNKAEKMQTGNLQNDLNNVLANNNMDKDNVINAIETLKQNPITNFASRFLGININELESVYKNQPNNQKNINSSRLDKFR